MLGCLQDKIQAAQFAMKDYTQYFAITHKGKESEKNYVCMYN